MYDREIIDKLNELWELVPHLSFGHLLQRVYRLAFNYSDSATNESILRAINQNIDFYKNF